MSAPAARVRDFAQQTNGGHVARWMRWPGWELYVGCDACAGDGPAARCWGREDCHGYLMACGCQACAAWDALAEQKARDRVFAQLTAGLRPKGDGTLRAQLAELDASIQSKGRSS